MSDHDKTNGGHDDHDDHGGAGHEVDKMPSGRLFNLLFGLSALTLVACIGVVQLFYRQVDTIRDTRDTKLSFQLAEYRQEMDELKSGYVVVMMDDDGVPAAEGGRGVFEARHFQMPLAEARKRVLEQPQQLLKAARPYRGWRNPDANAPKSAPTGPMPRNPMRPVPPPDGKVVPLPGAPGAPGGMGVQPVVPTAPGQPAQPVQPEGAQPGAGGKAPADAPAEGKPANEGEGKSDAKKGEGKARGETKSDGKAAEGKTE